MSATSPALSTITKVFNNLSYEPVLDSDSAVKTWISSHSNGVFQPFINGEFLTTEKSTFEVKNPYNESILGKVVNCDKETLDLAVKSAKDSLKSWRDFGFIERGKIIYNIARNLQKHIQVVTSCESLNSGRTSREIKDLDLATIIKTFYYYAGSVSLSSLNNDSLESVGVCAIAGYYDSPLLSMCTKLAAALATGNTCVLIPHRLTPLSAYMLLEICVQSQVPSGVINLIASDNDEIYKLISTHPDINCITYDGKTNIGQEIIIANSSLYPNKQVLLSLDGKASMAIYDSADIDSSIEAAVDGCFYSNGQHRYSLNKIFVQENICDEVSGKLEARFERIRVGNHLDKCNDFGPLVNKSDLFSFKEGLSKQIKENGAEVKTFEKAIQPESVSNNILPPTIIKNAALNVPLNLNESNGPYVMLIPFRTVKESIELINTSKFGSAVAIFSQNISLGFLI